MGKFSNALRRFLRLADYTLKASGAETASTTGASVELGDASSMYLEVVVSAIGGTPTMVVDVEGSSDGTNWVVIGKIGSDGYTSGSKEAAPANITAAGTYRAILPAARFVRYKSTIGGTAPSFTYAVTAEA